MGNEALHRMVHRERELLTDAKNEIQDLSMENKRLRQTLEWAHGYLINGHARNAVGRDRLITSIALALIDSTYQERKLLDGQQT